MSTEILQGRQKIVIIMNNDKENLGEISPENFARMLPGLKKYLRYELPLTKVGSKLALPINGRESSSIVQSVDAVTNTLDIRTHASRYQITFVGIDLQKIISDGPVANTNELTPFPTLQS